LIVLFKKEDLGKSGDSVNLGIPVMEKLEILKMSAEAAEKEASTSWRRYAMMLYASIGLLLVLLLTLKVTKFWTISIPALIGILVSFAWLKINALSSRNAQRWQADVAATIESDKTLQEWVTEKGLPVSSGSFPDKKVQFYFNLLPHAFLGLWAFVFLAAISSGSWRTTLDSGGVEASKGSPVNVEERVLAKKSEQGAKSADTQVASESSGSHTSQEGTKESARRRRKRQAWGSNPSAPRCMWTAER
jgi:hypothetical protein